MNFTELTTIIEAYKLGDLASIIGLIVALVGFAITIINVIRSRQASDAASDSVARVREDLKRMETVSDFSAALASMEDIKRLHRDNAWQLLPERYSILRKSLISIREDQHNLTDDDKAKIQSAITKLSTMENNVDKHLHDDDFTIDIPKINSIITKQIDQLNVVLVRLRNDIGE